MPTLWVIGTIVAVIIALVIEAIRFEKRMTSVSKTEALRRLLSDNPPSGGGGFEKAQDDAQRQEAQKVHESAQGEHGERIE